MLKTILVLLLGIPICNAVLVLRDGGGIGPVRSAAQQREFREYNRAINNERLTSPDDPSPEVGSGVVRDAQRVPMGPSADWSALAHNGTEPDLLREELSMLSKGQLRRFRRVQQGRVSKDQVEIVLARYDEDVRWVGPYRTLVTVYCKKVPALPGCIKLPNVGREGHTYLHHIVENYDKLARWTVFSQATQPTVGYPRFCDAGHMMPGVSFHDYVLGGGSVFTRSDAGGMRIVFNSALRLDGQFLHRHVNEDYQASSQLGNSTCKQRRKAAHRQTNPCTVPKVSLSQRTTFVSFQEFLSKRCNVTFEEVPGAFFRYFDLLHLRRPPNDTFFFSQGARFAASRARIHQRPREFYKAMLKILARESSPCEGFFNEWLWYYIAGKPTHSACSG